ncbi:MAG: ATP-binding protein [Deltaproteobacteria bacterium]|jgi:hypothetical protein|nr:ATP-binding protein [Deltaproteobacteria bacterium]
MKTLPLSMQSLKKIIDKGAVYVDKTYLFTDLIENEQIFLSRPRRFGKSLLLNSLEQMFLGNADLFSGLKIADSGYEFQKYPVIRLSMTMVSKTPEILTDRLLKNLQNIAESYNIGLRDDDPGGALQLLIKDLSEKYGERVVVLIDEYDHPVSSHMDNIVLAKANTEVLSSFYVGFKEMDDFLRFVLVTGVTRYAMMGLSSGLNQLVDISFDPEFAAICGFTPDELDQYFGERYSSTLKDLKSTGDLPPESSEADLRQKILDWYDGYTWDGKTRILNPISILNFFKKRILNPYWSATSPSISFLTKEIETNPLSFTNTYLHGYSYLDISLATVGNVNPVPLLFHSGYLTIDKISRIDGDLQYSFTVPNFEVEKPFYKILNEYLFIKNIVTEAAELNEALVKRNGTLLTKIIRRLFLRIPAEHYKKNEKLGESFFHMILMSYCSGLLPEVRSEPAGPVGDADLILISTGGLRAVLELKFAPDADPDKLEEALDNLANLGLKAIDEKEYGESDRLKGYDFAVIGVGVIGRGKAKAVFGVPRNDPC